MSGKYVKRKKNRIVQIAAAVIAAVVLTIVVLQFSGKGLQTQLGTSASADDTVKLPVQTVFSEISLDNGLTVLDIGSYTGVYMEDGSDEVVSGILMMMVRNDGEETIQYARLTMDVNGKIAEFTASTLKPGATAVLLEQNRMRCDNSLKYENMPIVCENLALFNTPLELHEDKLKIQILDGAINVTNVSSSDISKRISIYYKNVTDGVYYGGITYRITLENGLKADEVRQMMASHFSDTGSQIMFITIAE